MSDAPKSLSELTSHCIRCGFCLESCPTFKISGEESESPRGRIYLIRSAEEQLLDWKADVRPHIDKCLGCRACETACPSGVEYGAIFEIAKSKLVAEDPSFVRKLLLKVLTNRKLADLQFRAAGLLPGRKLPSFMQRFVSNQPVEARIPSPQKLPKWPALDESALLPIRGEVALLSGCVMSVLFDPVHEATERLLRRVGFKAVRVENGCCGALWSHSGYPEEARKSALELAKKFPEQTPIIVNSAGCGSTMKEYVHLDTSLAEVGSRVMDISEFLEQNGLLESLQTAKGMESKVTYHDACHLVNGQRVSTPPRRLLEAIPSIELVELPEADLCCGSAGTYNVTQPKMARDLLDRKWSNIEQTDCKIVVMGNPGCQAWIQQASEEHGSVIKVMHLAEILESAFSGMRQ